MEDGAVSCNVGDASENKIAHCDAAHQGVQGDMVPGEYAQLLPRHWGGWQIYALLRRTNETLRQGRLLHEILRTDVWASTRLVFHILFLLTIKTKPIRTACRCESCRFENFFDFWLNLFCNKFGIASWATCKSWTLQARSDGFFSSMFVTISSLSCTEPLGAKHTEQGLNPCNPSIFKNDWILSCEK